MDLPPLPNAATRAWICRDCQQASSPLIDGVCVPCREADDQPQPQRTEPSPAD
jgi:hypothetical protein